MDSVSQYESIEPVFDDGEPIIEFEHIFDDELEEMARDKDIEQLQRLCEREIQDYS